MTPPILLALIDQLFREKDIFSIILYHFAVGVAYSVRAATSLIKFLLCLWRCISFS